MRKNSTRAWPAMLGLTLAACGGGSNPAASTMPPIESTPAGGVTQAGNSGSTSAAQTIEVTITYEGKHTGSLTVGAFLHNPPDGPPLAFSNTPHATFPTEVTLTGLEPGKYYAVAVLDLPPASPTVPGPEDLVVESEAITLASGATQKVAVTLVDR